MSIKIILRLPGSFFFSVMIPLNFIHFYHLSTSTSLFLIQDSKWIFNIREIGFHQNFLLIDDFGRNSDTFLELGYVENIMDGCESRRKSQTISHGSTFFNDFIWPDIAR